MIKKIVQWKRCQLLRSQSGHCFLIHDPLRRQEIPETGSENNHGKKVRWKKEKEKFHLQSIAKKKYCFIVSLATQSKCLRIQEINHTDIHLRCRRRLLMTTSAFPWQRPEKLQRPKSTEQSLPWRPAPTFWMLTSFVLETCLWMAATTTKTIKSDHNHSIKINQSNTETVYKLLSVGYQRTGSALSSGANDTKTIE